LIWLSISEKPLSRPFVRLRRLRVTSWKGAEEKKGGKKGAGLPLAYAVKDIEKNQK
jgi:hypothetical protein